MLDLSESLGSYTAQRLLDELSAEKESLLRPQCLQADARRVAARPEPLIRDDARLALIDSVGSRGRKCQDGRRARARLVHRGPVRIDACG